MKENKEKELLYSYIADNNVIMVYMARNNSTKVVEMIENVVQFEKPDMYSIVDNEAMIIEHFEFDSYKADKKGSNYRYEEGIIKQNFDKMLNNRKNKNSIMYNDTIYNTASKEKYINNFKNNFSEHYDRIEIYKKRIKEISGGKQKIYFFIEDASPLGSYCFNADREPRTLLIFQFKEIIDFLLSHKKVSGIIYGYYNGKEKRLMFLENNKTSIKKLIKDCGFADECDCYWFEVNVSAFSQLITKI